MAARRGRSITAWSSRTGEIVVALDADTQFEPTTIARLARWFADPTLGAVAGNAKVGNRVNIVTRWQALEYITAQNLERRALARLDAMTVVPGAVGAWRKRRSRRSAAIRADTLAEDQDLTIAIQRAGWQVRLRPVCASPGPRRRRPSAGSPSSASAGPIGTLQCLWKHGAIMATGRPRGLALVGLPQAIVFQIAARGDLPDHRPRAGPQLLHDRGSRCRSMAGPQTQTDVDMMLAYWLVFTAIDLLPASSPSRSSGARIGGCCGC